MNYFALFEIPVSLKVDATDLLKKYYALSRQYHPDNFTLSDLKSQEESEQMIAAINEAKKILDSPYKRLEYILHEKKVIADDEKYSLSPAFLGEMMDINEQLMELEFDKNELAFEKIKVEIKEKERIIYIEVKAFFEADELLLSDTEAQILKEYYYKKKYLQRIAERLN